MHEVRSILGESADAPEPYLKGSGLLIWVSCEYAERKSGGGGNGSSERRRTVTVHPSNERMKKGDGEREMSLIEKGLEGVGGLGDGAR